MPNTIAPIALTPTGMIAIATTGVTLSPDNAAAKIAKALFEMYKGVTSQDYLTLYSVLPDIIKNLVIPKVKEAIGYAKDVVFQFVQGEILTKAMTILDTSNKVMTAIADLMPDSVAPTIQRINKLAAMIKDFALAGVSYISAIFNLVLAIAGNLIPSTSATVALALDAGTTAYLASAGIA